SERHLAYGCGTQREGQVDGVQDQARGPGRADGEVVLAGVDRTRLENQVRTVQRRAAQLGLTDLGGGTDAGQVLRLQSRLRRPGTDVAKVKAPARDQGQRQACSQDLPAAFAEGTVDFQE